MTLKMTGSFFLKEQTAKKNNSTLKKNVKAMLHMIILIEIVQTLDVFTL